MIPNEKYFTLIIKLLKSTKIFFKILFVVSRYLHKGKIQEYVFRK